MNKVVEAIPQDGFRLRLRFNDGVEGVVDLSDLAGRGVMSLWNDPEVFNSASVTETGAVEWPGGVDVCGDALYLRVTGKKPEEVFPNLAVRIDA